MTAGYLHADYARSFAGSGEPFRLQRAGGWLIRRPVGGGPHHDLACPYPLFLCEDLAQVPRDLASLDTENLASVVFVTDPFYQDSVEEALAGFDLVVPFKTHHVAQLDRPWRSFARRNCRRYARHARRDLEIRVVDDPSTRAVALWDLFRQVLDQRQVSGSGPLSREIVSAHLLVPGTTLFEVADSRRVLALGSFYEIEDRAYAHLMGMSQEGRSRLAAYGLYGAALDYFQTRVSRIDFGGNAGEADRPEDGLSRFKHGWVNQTRTAYLCGKILNPELYASLCAAAGCGDASYFPAYRMNERQPGAAR